MATNYIVKHEGNGSKINALFTDWLIISTVKEFNTWAENIRSSKFGTYKNLRVSNLLDSLEPKFNSQFLLDSFKEEVKWAENNVNI